MKQSPTVSIGLPVYNGEDYIQEALDSILAQTYTDFELIISDNASTDATERICREFAKKDNRVRYIRNKVNFGAAKNYNVLVDLAEGKYFKWAAHDDLLAPTYLEKCIETFKKHPEAILVYPQTEEIDEKGCLLNVFDDGFNLTSDKPHERFKNFFEAPKRCNPVFGLMRTDDLKRTAMIGSYKSSDKILLGQFALLGKIYEVPERLFYRRIHSGMSTVAHKSEADIATWFSTEKRKSIQYLFPRWRWVFEHFKNITRAPINYTERVKCYFYVVKHLVMHKRWTKREIKTAVNLVSNSLRLKRA